MTIRYLVVAMTTALFAIPLSAEAQSSFDCRRPRSDAAATICRDPDLSARDQQVDLAYRKALNQVAEPNRVRDNHTAWANGLVGCGSDRQCIAQSYAEELRALAYATETSRQAELEAESLPEQQPVRGPAPPLERNAAEPTGRQDAGPDRPDYDVFAATPVAREEDERVGDLSSVSQNATPDETSPAPERKTAPASKLDQFLGGGIILGLLVAVVFALLATKALADHSARRYGWPMILNWWNILHLVAVGAWVGLTAMGSPVGGVVVAAGLWLLVLAVNIRKTDVATGLAMTVVQPLVVVIIYVVIQFARYKPKPYNYISRS